MDRHLAGSAIFQLFEAAGGAAPASSRLAATAIGDLITEVGVAATRLFQRFNLIVTSLDQFDTGLAIAFPPIDEGDEAGVVRTFNASLFDNQNRFIPSKQGVTVPLQGHTSLFVSELFPDLPESAGVDIHEFEGILQVSSSDFMAPLALRSAGAKLTSTPTLAAQLNGFAPTSTIEFAQTLAGTSPSVKWTLHQNQKDFALEKVKISAPDLGLNVDNIEEGGRLAFGYLARGTNSRVFEFVVTGKGSLEFETMISNSDGLFRQGTGRIEGTPGGGLTLELTLDGKKPFTEVGGDADQHFFLPPGIIQAPPSEEEVELIAELTSVSSRPDREVPILRRTSQKVSFVNPDPVKANLEWISPLFPQPEEVAFLSGTNLGDSPTITFTSLGGTGTVEAPAFRRDDETLGVLVPPSVTDGAVRADNGTGAGNPCQIRAFYVPAFEAAFVEPETGEASGKTAGAKRPLGFIFTQQPEQLVMTDFVVELFDVDMTVGGLALESLVGTGRMQQGFNESRFDLKVVEKGENTVVLELVQTFDATSSFGHRLRVERIIIEGETTGLRFTYVPETEQEEPVILDDSSSLAYEFTFGDFPFVFPQVGVWVNASARIFSTPMGAGGRDASLEVILKSFVEIE